MCIEGNEREREDGVFLRGVRANKRVRVSEGACVRVCECKREREREKVRESEKARETKDLKCERQRDFQRKIMWLVS